MKNDKMKLQMRILKITSLITIGVGLWMIGAQIIHDKDSINMFSILPFLFAGWIGDIAHKVLSQLAHRLSELEKQSGV